MAKRVEVTLVDDLDGSAAQQTITFSLDGSAYEIDLSDENSNRLRDALARYIEASRKVSSTPGRRRTRSASRPAG
ncbi:Lsr2 family protein [Nocardioides sp.]|uniref:histone-like nucleoid-structuring protein Lsr2 n=1 Tax=Nocardioides sp. TaxID=35761 RepID=UPI0035AEEAC2